ncbi:MAG TPA: serine protease [Candidatus Scatomonas merdigallinarum]|nr:serine protease [Candidatus Scatomonas merdigallinarum]
MEQKPEHQEHEQKELEKKNYSFIREIVKKKPLDKRGLLRKILSLAGAAVLAGVVASFVFVWMVPVAERMVNGDSSRVSFPEDEEETSTSSQSVTDSSQPAQETPMPASQPEIGLEEYRQLYKDMLAVAEKPKRALVTVVGISSEMDYFNQNYENQKQISGLLAADNGQDLFILTEYRVVENVERIQVTFYDGSTVDAIYQRHDANTGLTILKVGLSELEDSTREGIELAPLGSSYGVTQGEPVMALGSPMGYSDSVAYGVITSVTNKISTLDTEYNLLTTDINGSGEGSGVLINLDGEIIGIIAQSYSTEDKDIITALAVSQIKDLIESLSNDEARPYIGIKGQDVTAQISHRTGIPKGVLVTAVQADSPAMLAGMKEYDVVVKIGEDEISSFRQYRDRLDQLTPGQTVILTAMRRGAEGYAEVEFEVTVGEI